jgi:uncharacterized membrane protein YhhN
MTDRRVPGTATGQGHGKPNPVRPAGQVRGTWAGQPLPRHRPIRANVNSNGFSSATDMATPSAHSRTRLLWVAATVVGACYGVFLIVTALRLPSGDELTGQFALQPAVKASTAVLLALAALTHPIARERRWLIAALLFSAAGDFLLAMPWWAPSFVLVCVALLARLPTPWTGLGAVCFAVSDGMIGIGKFVLAPTNTEALAVPIWWAYAASILLITAGFLFGRASVSSATSS